MLFLRIFQHLLPTGEAWRTTVDKALRRLFVGLSSSGDDARQFVDLVYLDLFPGYTRELVAWESQFGLSPTADATELARRQALAAEWSATGGQSPGYIQGVLQTAGFPVYVHEWWEPPNVAPRTARDPRDHTEVPLFGTYQCGMTIARCGVPRVRCNRFLANEPGYFDNLDLTRRAPPPIPADTAKHRYFLYIGSETFPDRVQLPSERRAEFERLIQKIKPAQQWVVTLIDFLDTLLTEDGDNLTTEDGDPIAA
jgi:uncharacterized protein YmfQ (DUF2313 family)